MSTIKPDQLEKLLRSELFDLATSLRLPVLKRETKKSLVEKLTAFKNENPEIELKLENQFDDEEGEDEDGQTLNDFEGSDDDSDIEVTQIEQFENGAIHLDSTSIHFGGPNSTGSLASGELLEDDENDEDFALSQFDQLKASVIDHATDIYELRLVKYLDYAKSSVTTKLVKTNNYLIHSLSSISSIIVLLSLVELSFIFKNFTPLIKSDYYSISILDKSYNIKYYDLSLLFGKLFVSNLINWTFFQLLLPLIVSYYIKFKINFAKNDSLIYALSKSLIFYVILKKFNFSQESVSFNELSSSNFLCNYFENFGNFADILGTLPLYNGFIVILLSLYV